MSSTGATAADTCRTSTYQRSTRSFWPDPCTKKPTRKTLSNFVIAHRAQLQPKPSLLISVSLSIAFDNGEAEARHYVDGFVDYTGFKPSDVALTAGALKHDQYDYYMNQIVENVVLENRGVIKGDREFTDWNAVAAKLDAFVASV